MAKPGTAPAVLTILLATGLAVAAEWWEKKPYTQWSDKEVQRMIDNSPWGKVHTVTIMNPTTTGDRSYQTVGSGDLEREKKNLFHLHFLGKTDIDGRQNPAVHRNEVRDKGYFDLSPR